MNTEIRMTDRAWNLHWSLLDSLTPEYSEYLDMYLATRGVRGYLSFAEKESRIPMADRRIAVELYKELKDIQK